MKKTWRGDTHIDAVFLKRQMFVIFVLFLRSLPVEDMFVEHGINLVGHVSQYLFRF